jgi:Rod binding domain-containing protein
MDGIKKTALPLVPKTAPAADPHRTKVKNLNKQAEEAAGQFETMMAVQMLRTMQSSLENGGMFGGGVAGDIYSGLTEWQLGQLLSHGGKLGIKEQILQQLPKSKDQSQ